MDRTAVEIRNITKTYPVRTGRGRRKDGSNTVLGGISLTVDRGEILGILGGNGSGKSTLLKILSGIIAPSSGEVVINGKVASILELTVGFHEDLSGLENIYVRQKLYGIPKEDIDRKLDGIIGYADIGDYIYNPIRTYSTGMRSRLAFAIMVNVDADVFIIDEALSVGDARFNVKTMGFLERMAMEGKTVLITSHSTYVLRTFCSRAVILEGGLISADGDPDEVCRQFEILDIGSPEELLRYAELGVPQAEYRLQKQCLAAGDRAGYENWLSMAAYGSCPKAMTEYARFCAGKGDVARAMGFSLKAAKRGDDDAKWLHQYLNQGFDGKDMRQGLKTIAGLGDHFDAYRYAHYLRLTATDDGALATAYRKYRAAQNLGNRDARYALALMTLDGLGTAADPAGAVDELRRLAEEGSLDAMEDLTRICSEGIYMSADRSEEFRWKLKLANAGIPKFQFMVAQMYTAGIGTEKDPEKAAEWFRRFTISSLENPLADAAQSANVIDADLKVDSFAINSFLTEGYSKRAMVQNLSVMLDQRKVKNPETVFRTAEQAANTAGTTQSFLADCYYKGIGTEPDIAKAFGLYSTAADYGSTRAMMTIALMYKYGVGVERDMEMFERYIRMAAKRDNAVALAIVDELDSKTRSRIRKIANPRNTNRKSSVKRGATR